MKARMNMGGYKMGKYFEKIMEKMCSYVDVKWKDINPKKEKWYMEYSWTAEQLNDFENWFIDYLYNNSEARKEILTSGKRKITKKQITKAVDEFLLNYGWTVK